MSRIRVGTRSKAGGGKGKKCMGRQRSGHNGRIFAPLKDVRKRKRVWMSGEKEEEEVVGVSAHDRHEVSGTHGIP